MSRRHRYARLLLMLRLMRWLRIGEWQAVVLQALLMGLAGASAALVFDHATLLLQYLCTGIAAESCVARFEQLPGWGRILLPALGALPAALVLRYALQKARYEVPEYMEAFSLGDGRLPRRQGFWRSLSAVLSLGSGAAIGKEGALMQISAVAASAMGRWIYVSPPRLRLMVGCGAAAGMTAAFHTPLTACLFVCEVVVGTFSVGTLAPLLLASCAAYVLVWLMGTPGALFAVPVGFANLSAVALCAMLGLLAALLAKMWVWLLNSCRRLLSGRIGWLVPRMMLAGLAVGIVSVFEPYVVGNGYEAICALTHGLFAPERAAALLIVKALMVAIVFGVGTMGGVLTPTLLSGALVGLLFGYGVEALGWGAAGGAVAYAFIGMAAFFAVAGRAPVTALLLVIEFSMSAQLIFPLMVGVGVAYALGRLLPGRCLYDASVRSGPASAFDAKLSDLCVGDVCRRTGVQVGLHTGLDRVLRLMLRHPGENVPVQDEDGRCIGVVAYTQAVSAASQECATVREVLDRSVPLLHTQQSLPQALELFEAVRCDSLPVVSAQDGCLVGVMSRAELYQVIALMLRRELAQSRGV